MIFLLDTNIASELRKNRPHGAVLSWYKSYAESEFALPSLALYEIQEGIEIVRSRDPAKASEIERWVESIEREAVVLPLDARAARVAAQMMRNQPTELTGDAMIAAIAKVNGLTVATRNTPHFERFAVPLVNPFQFPRS